MSADEFLAWEREQVGRHDWFQGEVFAMAGGTPRHAALGAALAGELRAALRGGPCRVLSSDQKVVARPGAHFVYPDASVVCGPLEVATGTTDVLANPTVLVEVLSASSEKYDRGLKWEGYQHLASLRDYLLVSQSAPRIEHFQREVDEGGRVSWRYRELGRGEGVTLWNGAVVEVDAVFEGVFDLEGE
jgi:Uma2 family endonuclease